jgi:hypothetical protein
MKRLLSTLAAAALLMGAIGCQHPYLARHGCGDSHCNHCAGPQGGLLGGHGAGRLGGRGVDRHAGHGAGLFGGHGAGRFAGMGPRGGGGPDGVPPLPPGYQQQLAPAGPAGPQVAYPYYTIRGPRDFFLNEPNPLGR